MKYLTVKQAAEKLKLNEGHIRRLCASGDLLGAARKGKSWQIPVSAHPDLRGALAPAVKDDPEELLKVPLPKRQQATERLGLLKQMEKYIGGYLNHGGNRTDAIACFADMQGCSVRSLTRWSKRYREQGILGLVDARGGRTDDDSISPEAWDIFKDMWLDQRRLSVPTCYKNLVYLNHSQQQNWQLPSERNMYRLIHERIPMPAQVLHREGMEAYNAKCAPYIITDREAIEPGSVWIGDHHQCNCWVRNQGRWIRPWLTAWEDMRSRALVGYCVTASPNQSTIMLAFRKGCQDYGPPESVKIDNGKDYDSQMWTGTTKKQRQKKRGKVLDDQQCQAIIGLYAMMNIDVSFSIPYHPQSKAIERFFDSFDRQLIKSFDTYCGKGTHAKPDTLNDYLKTDKAIAAADDLESFAAKVDRYLKVYNSQPHSANKGQTPASVMSTRQSRRVIADGTMDLLLQVWSGELTIGKNGVKFEGNWYGQFNPELLRRQGQKVRVSYDPDDITEVRVFTKDFEFITTATQHELEQYGKVHQSSLREAMKQKRKAAKDMKSYRKTTRIANMRLSDLTIEAAEHAAQLTEQDQQQRTPQPPTIKPVQTPLDNAVTDVKRKEQQQQLRKAVGADTVSAIDLDLDSLTQPVSSSENSFSFNLSALEPNEEPTIRLFENGQ